MTEEHNCCFCGKSWDSLCFVHINDECINFRNEDIDEVFEKIK